MAAEVGDPLDAHAAVGQQGHEAVPQLATGPDAPVNAHHCDDRAEGPPQIVPVEGAAGGGGKTRRSVAG